MNKEPLFCTDVRCPLCGAIKNILVYEDSENTICNNCGVDYDIERNRLNKILNKLYGRN